MLTVKTQLSPDICNSNVAETTKHPTVGCMTTATSPLRTSPALLSATRTTGHPPRTPGHCGTGRLNLAPSTALESRPHLGPQEMACRASGVSIGDHFPRHSRSGIGRLSDPVPGERLSRHASRRRPIEREPEFSANGISESAGAHRAHPHGAVTRVGVQFAQAHHPLLRIQIESVTVMSSARQSRTARSFDAPPLVSTADRSSPPFDDCPRFEIRT